MHFHNIEYLEGAIRLLKEAAAKDGLGELDGSIGLSHDMHGNLIMVVAHDGKIYAAGVAAHAVDWLDATKISAA